ncbi:MAG TPA: hypothetical protein VLA61_18460 [Ideonella sp.]|uniref:hypothetical protein n=1 Tax=Ideonella sp. TaxID=1929293 RepID=UPI002CA43E8E|nr:hypothetical protein [Ideonella sp.]HSI50259.1 hypothetical protein [Ideonella sp.]
MTQTSDTVNQAFLRIYADCQDGDEARRLAQALELVLSFYDPVATAAPARYWKIPELFGFTYRLSSSVRDIWADLLSDPDDWRQAVDEHERSAVWNRLGDRRFLIAEARWAELQTQAQ